MAITINKDYVFAPKVWMLTHDGVLLGTKKYLLCVPSKEVEYSYDTVTTTKFSLEGKTIPQAISDMIAQTNTIEELEDVMLDLAENFGSGAVELFHFDDLDGFKVQAGFLGSGIHVKKMGKRGYSPFVQKLGKDKKEIQAFFADHPKLD